MVFLSPTTKCAVVFLAVLFVAIRSAPSSILLHVNAFVPTTNHHRRCNHCNNWSKSSSSPPRPSSLFVQLPWPQSQQSQQQQQQQQERIEQWSPEEVNDEPHGRQPTSPQQQQQEYLENIVSYDTGGNSFAQPIEPSELSVGRRNGKTMYSTVGFCSTSSSSRSRSGTYRRALPKQSKPDIVSPGELTVGRTRDNGYSKSTSGGQLHHQQGEHQQSGGGILQHYGTGAFSFSQPINPSESITGGIRSRSDGGRPRSLSFQKQEGYSGIHYIQSLQSSNADNDNDEYRNGNWASGDENNWGDHLLLAAGTMK